MVWKPGEKLSVSRLNRLTSTIPTSYTVFRDGTKIRAESTLPNNPPYESSDFYTVVDAALTDLHGAGGGIVTLKHPGGTPYILTDTLVIPEHCGLVGEHQSHKPIGAPTQGVVINFQPTSAKEAITASGTGWGSDACSGVKLKGFHLVGKNSYAGVGDYVYDGLIHLEYCADWVIEDVHVSHSRVAPGPLGGNGIVIHQCSVGFMDKCIIQDCEASGLVCAWTSDGYFSNLDIFGNTTNNDPANYAQLLLRDSAANIFTNIRAGDGPNHSLMLWNAYHNNITGMFYEAGKNTVGTADCINLKTGSGCHDNTIFGQIFVIDNNDVQTTKPNYGIDFVDGVVNNLFVGSIRYHDSRGRVPWQGGTNYLSSTLSEGCGILWTEGDSMSFKGSKGAFQFYNIPVKINDAALNLNDNRLYGIQQQADNPVLGDLFDGEIRFVHTANNRVYYRVNGVLYYVTLTAA